MDAILQVMTADHRHCDEYLAAAETAVAHADLAAARQAFGEFSRLTEAHFTGEEGLLFPAFEARSGMRLGPTEMMRQEHAQMRDLIASASAALALGDVDAYCAEVETLLILMQQHNMKEENILYPMCDHHLGPDAPAFAARLEQNLHEKTVIE